VIKINLATRKTSSVAAPASTSGKTGTFTALNFRLDSLDLQAMKDLPIRKFAVVALLSGVIWFLESSIKQDKLNEAQTQITQATEQQAAVRAELDKTKGYDQLRKALEADEATIRGKIDTIRKLIQDRQVPPKLLAALSNGIPADVWIREFGIVKEGISIRGFSMGYTEISDFMKNLGESAYFTDLKMVDAKTGKDELGYEISDFQLTAKRRSSSE
jgi:Tfp pilus assembly protein PilN